MSILFKAVAGLAAGVVAGGLGLAFLPRLEPSALKPRSAVEKPQFVVATDASPTSPEPSATLAVAAEPKTPPAPHDQVAPATPQMVALRPAAPRKFRMIFRNAPQSEHRAAKPALTRI